VKRAEELSSKDRKLRGVFKGNIKKAGAPKQIGLKTLFKRVKARTLLKEAEEQLAEELEEDKKSNFQESGWETETQPETTKN